jgi:uncharacterized protein YecT (DUF1311 family)
MIDNKCLRFSSAPVAQPHRQAAQMPAKFWIGALLALTLPAVVCAEDKPCSQTNPLAVLECLNAKTEVAAAELKALYSAVLARRPDAEPTDTRKEKGQLVKAQQAWRNYVTEHCAFVGGLEGGSNLWVTTFTMQCVLQETQERIDFFKDLTED